MIDSLGASLSISSSGLAAQSRRLRVITENIANASTTGRTPEADPYRRKTVTFASVLDLKTGLSTVAIDRIGTDRTDFLLEYDPSHPAAGSDGMVRMPNVNLLVEMGDMREAVRSYEANLETFKQARQLVTMTIDLLRT
ncbi:MAG: flagellar basal-body rod protein FlgC [Alphaproteobacteria bacterium]|nr:MAG: flagellar basal-body rod protein FlgC [Alphaproteobacteria bacterium]